MTSMEGGETLEYVLEWIRGHYFGKYRGTVADNDDQSSRGRVKVNVPSVLDSLDVWAMPSVPYAGNGVGFYSIPAKGAGVWVEFEGGDPSYPIWSGCYWSDHQLPDKSDAKIKIWKTEKAMLRLDDGSGEAKIVSNPDSSGSTLTLASGGATLEYSQSSFGLADDSVTIASNGSQHVVGVDGITSQAVDGGTVDVTATVSVNDGAFEVA